MSFGGVLGSRESTAVRFKERAPTLFLEIVLEFMGVSNVAPQLGALC